MKKIYFIYLLMMSILILFLTSLTFEEEKYYYAFDQKILLVAKPNTVLVKYTDVAQQSKSLEALEKLYPNLKIKWHSPSIVEITSDSKKSADNIIVNLKMNEAIYTCQPLYTLKNGLVMGVTDEILVRFFPEVTQEQQKILQRNFEVKVIKATKIYQKLKVKEKADALEIANKIYESGLVEFSTPNFISYSQINQIIPNDTYFSRQITCHNTGQVIADEHSGTPDADIDAPEAWEITAGNSDIVVAVLDEGITSNHPDLPNTRQIRLNGSNFGDGNANDPSPTGNMNHGNACAGVIAATMNNNQGISGIAPNCKIMPIRIFNSNKQGVIPELNADAIEFAVDNGAKILSNSWSYGSSDQNLHPVIVAAINYAINNNRIVIFSAGNTANHVSGNNGYVAFPANANIPNLITVGASDRNDNQANYSPTSNLIDIVAPSHRAYPSQIAGETLEMWSIDIPNNTGYNPWPSDPLLPHPPTTGENLPNSGTNYLAYTGRFGGTSHACPVVAGVAALMLSINPSLTPQQIFNILMNTANDVGGYSYSNGKCNEMGHGRVNAHLAVIAAIETIPIVGASMICNQETYTIQNPTGTAVQWTASSNITIVSGQGTPSVTVSKSASGNYGEGWIHAGIILNGTEIGTASRMIDYVGTPVATSITGQTNVRAGQSASYTAYPSIIASGIEYKWYVYPSTVSTSPWNNTNYITFYNAGTYSVSCQIISPCGFGSAANILVTVTGNGGYYAIYPNPATDMITIEVKEEQPAGTNPDRKGYGKYEIQLWNSVGIVKKSITDQSVTHLSISDLPKGLYMVLIMNDGKIVYRQKLIKY